VAATVAAVVAAVVAATVTAVVAAVVAAAGTVVAGTLVGVGAGLQAASVRIAIKTDNFFNCMWFFSLSKASQGTAYNEQANPKSYSTTGNPIGDTYSAVKINLSTGKIGGLAQHFHNSIFDLAAKAFEPTIKRNPRRHIQTERRNRNNPILNKRLDVAIRLQRIVVYVGAV
jgi:hypothetical protein